MLSIFSSTPIHRSWNTIVQIMPDLKVGEIFSFVTRSAIKIPTFYSIFEFV